MTCRIVVLLLIACPVFAVRPVSAQGGNVQAVTVGDVAIGGSLRTRAYSWNWFGDTPNGEYTYPASLLRVGLSESKDRYDWRAEFAVPIIIGLPATAVAPAPRGQLGLGAAYVGANDGRTNLAGLFLKQGFVRFKRLGGLPGQSLTLGRMEFNDGAETVPADRTLATLKRDRISQRLLGNFGFSDVERSIDGAQYNLTRSRTNVTAIAGRPTQGVFDINGWPELNITIAYGAVTHQVGERQTGEWRLFALAYDDRRGGVVKTDSRPLATRSPDKSSITLATYGGHYGQIVETASGPIDLLLWGAIQTGSWGTLTQRAAAFAVEAGWQPRILGLLEPWLRGGFDYGSGAHDPASGTHGTFFQPLPTPRVYARFPFFNMMNTQDAFGELMFKAAKRVAVRADVHALSLADANDLWYSGGGAFQPASFGYTGRPSNGQTRLATLYDVSGDDEVTRHVAVGAYYGYAAKHGVIQAIYPKGGSGQLGFLEVLLRF